MDKFNTEIFQKCLQSSVIGRRLVYTGITGSTMDDARRLAHDVQEYPHGTLVMSERQTKARGAKDHKWDATNTGNIYASVVLHMPPVCKTFEGSFDLEVAACLAVLQVVKEFGVTRVRPKWPNDLWVRGHKLAGFLVEDGRLDIPGSTDCLFILGMGINVNADIRRSSDLQSIATSMVCERGGQYVDREQFLAEICASLEQMLTSKKEDYFRTFVKENLFQENCELSVSNHVSGKILDGKFMAICKNWDVKFLNPQSEEVFRGSSEVYSIRPKVMSKVMIVSSSPHNSSRISCLSKWLTSVIDTSKYVVCFIPEATITSTEEWMKNCSLLVLVEDVMDPDLVTGQLRHILRSGGSVMASGKGAVFLANILRVPVKQVLLHSSADSAVVPVLLQTKTVLCPLLPANEGNISKTANYGLSVDVTVDSAQSNDVCGLVKSVSSLDLPRTVIFPADPKCLNFFETDTSGCQLRDNNDGLCLVDPAFTSSVIPDKIGSYEDQVMAYFYNAGSQQEVLTVFTGRVECGGRVAMWGLDILPGANVHGVNLQDMKVVEDDRFRRDCLLQQVLEILLKS